MKKAHICPTVHPARFFNQLQRTRNKNKRLDNLRPLFPEHSSDYITVFCASAAGALALAIIVGVIIRYRHHNNKQHLEVKEETKFNTYGSSEPKMPTEVDPFLSGPIKTPLPDHMLEGYNWQRGGTLPHKSSQNGSVVRTFSAKDVHTKELNGER